MKSNKSGINTILEHWLDHLVSLIFPCPIVNAKLKIISDYQSMTQAIYVQINSLTKSFGIKSNALNYLRVMDDTLILERELKRNSDNQKDKMKILKMFKGGKSMIK